MNRNKFNHCVLIFVIVQFLLVSSHLRAQIQNVACVGNSITYGYGLSNPSGQSYPSQMQVLLGTTEWKVRNFGSSGRTMLKAGGYSYWDDQLYKDALESNPNYVMIELGTNDSKRWLWDSHGSEFKSDYKAMVQSFQSLNTKPEIWIGLLIPGEKADWDIYNSYIKDKVNPKIKEIALEMGLGLVDLYNELDTNRVKWYQVDSVHPSVAGSGVIAKKVEEMLLMSKPEVKYENGTVIAPDGDDFQWYLNGVPVSANKGGKLKEMLTTDSGRYKVSVKLYADNETRIVSKELNITTPGTSVHQRKLNGLKVFPNPAFDAIYIQSDKIESNAGYTISDLLGNVLLTGQIPNSNGVINISKLSLGIYVLVIGNEQLKMVKSN